MRWWHRWWRWRERNRRAGRTGSAVLGIVGLMLLLVAIDSAAKIWLHTEPWYMHYEPGVPPVWSLLLTIPYLVWKKTRWWCAIFVSGALGNWLWATNTEAVPNPFVADLTDGVDWTDTYALIHGGSQVGYNAADVFLTVGLVGAATTLMAWVLKESTRWVQEVRERGVAWR